MRWLFHIISYNVIKTDMYDFRKNLSTPKPNRQQQVGYNFI